MGLGPGGEPPAGEPLAKARTLAGEGRALLRGGKDKLIERIPETASRLRQRIEAVLDAAHGKGWRPGENPARWKGHLAGELPQPRRVKRVRHRPALAWQDMGAFMAALAARDGIAAQALGFAILTVARTGEVRGMCWREVDLDAKV